MQPMVVDISDTLMQHQEEHLKMLNDEPVKTLFSIKGVMSWHCDETETRNPHSTNFARKLLMPFPSSHLAECGDNFVNDLLLKKRNRLEINKRGDLSVKLTKLVSYIKSLCSTRISLTDIFR